MSSTVADPADTEVQASARLAAKAAKARAVAAIGPLREGCAVADIDRLPGLAAMIAVRETAMRDLYRERDAAILRLMTRAKTLGAPSHLSHAVVGFLAGGSKSLPGRVLLHRDT